MKHLLAIFLAFPLFAADGYFIVARGPALDAIRAYVDAKTEWVLAGTGAQNIALPAYLLSDGTNQVTVRARYTHVWRSQTNAKARQKFAQLALDHPNQFAWFPTTNGQVNVAALLASLPTPLAPKVPQPINQ